MSKQTRYSPEFKKETIRLVTELGQDVKKVAKDIGVHENTVYKWIQLYKDHPEVKFTPFNGQQVKEAI